MKIPLSPRLQACCSFIAPGERVADVGTDHGYLGIWLLQKGIARSVIASDIVPGPLSAARRNAEKFCQADRMEFHLSDGVRSIPRDFDTLVCAGMGADTMISILTAAPWLCEERYRLILQCQTKTALLRRYLSDSGWCIRQERIVRDGRFLYTVMEVIWKPATPLLTPGECYISPALLAHPGPELAEYYSRISEGLRTAVHARAEHADAAQHAALEELDALKNNPSLAWLKEEHHDNG